MMFAATAAALPPLDPPGARSGSGIDEARASQGGPTLGGDDVFDRHQYAVEIAERCVLQVSLLSGARLLAGPLGVDEGERVRFGVSLGDLLQAGAEHLDGRKLTTSIGTCEIDGAEQRDFR